MNFYYYFGIENEMLSKCSSIRRLESIYEFLGYHKVALLSLFFRAIALGYDKNVTREKKNYFFFDELSETKKLYKLVYVTHNQ